MPRPVRCAKIVNLRKYWNPIFVAIGQAMKHHFITVEGNIGAGKLR